MNVFVVENAPEIRSRLVKMLRTVAGINVVGEADSVNKAIEGVLASAATCCCSTCNSRTVADWTCWRA